MKSSKMFHLSKHIIPLSFFCLAVFGCKKDEDNAPSGPEVNNGIFSKVEMMSTGGSYSGVSSAIPDANNLFVYFTALDAPGTGVYKIPRAGGDAVPVQLGPYFVAPIDLALSSNNQEIFIADSGANSVLWMNISGHVPYQIPGTKGTRPVALDVIQKSGADVLYFCGRDSSDGQPVIYEIAATGALAPIIRHKGAPLVNPAGIVSDKQGILYVADKSGKVFKLTADGMIGEIASDIKMGSPAGIAMTPDDQNIAVSSKSNSDGTAQVYVINIPTSKRYIFNKVIGSNSNPGGLHAARSASGATGLYAWSDIQKPGHVYVVYR